MFQNFEVGKVVCRPSPDGIVFETTPAGVLLLLKMQRPTRKEVREFKNGRAKFRFVVKNDIIFFLAKFGALPWMDAPYYRKYAQFDGASLEVPPDGKGIALHAMLIDASSGVLVAQKLIGLSTELSRDLIAAMKAQPEINNYYNVVDLTQAMYSTPQLVKESER